MRAEHHNGKRTASLNLMRGQVDDMETLGIREAFRSKKQVLFSAAETAEMILRVDDIIKCAPRKRSGRQRLDVFRDWMYFAIGFNFYPIRLLKITFTDWVKEVAAESFFLFRSWRGLDETQLIWCYYPIMSRKM